jgi:hypothetical protein
MIKYKLDEKQVEILYKELKSSYKVAKVLNTSATAVKRVLKNLGVLRTQKLAALERDNHYVGKYKRTEQHKDTLSQHAKRRIGSLNPFFGKTHTPEVKERLKKSSSSRLGKLNPNYKHGKNLRRPRDFKNADFQKLRNVVFNRDKFTCQITGIKGGRLHAHHLIPYWVCPEAFFDIENIITVSTETHFKICHNGSWGSFNVDLITDSLVTKYNLDRDRLNEMASYFKRRCESQDSENK